jgi:tetratricopeptide (TPR) repeat protein
LSRQLNYHDDTVVNDHNLSEEVREFGLPSEEYDVWPDLPTNVLQPFLESRSIIVVEQEDKVSEEAALKDPSTLAGKLTRYLRQNREYTPQALTVRFELAEALIEIGKYDEAEDHCRDLIAIDSQESVAALLGTIFARTGRLEESTKWLFIALANFILDCTNYSLQQNERLFRRIYYLFAELIWLSQRDWDSLTKTLKEMMVTLKDLRSDEDIHRACPELFIHAFHFAHNCTVLNFVCPAKYLYQHLLEPSSFYLNGRYASEKAKAHQMYGLLLSGEENWSSSAEQLLLTCESTIESGSYTHQHAAFLTITLNNLRPHLPSENDRPGSTVKTIETKLDYMKNQISVSDNGFSVLPVENYLQSNLPGLRGAIFLADMSLQAQLTLPVRSIVPSQGRTDSNSTLSRRGTVSDDVRVSKKSASSGPMSSDISGDGSHENGQTWPTSEWDEYADIKGICDKMSKTS